MAEKERILNPRVVIIMLVFIVVVPMLPLIISWQWDWWEAWVYAGINILGFAISRFLAGRKHPDLLVERGKYLDHQNPEPFDKLLSPLLGIVGGLMPIAAGLDMRFGPSAAFGIGVKIIALIVMLAGFAFASYALIANRFFSGMVRIQSDRGQHVVTGGPYSWVRHPGYAGALLSYLAAPFLLDSWWMMIPVALSFVILFIRTYLEDKTLQEKLAGYKEYTQQVRYRLIPGVW
jgi:protein-S-isoprenylcysteine O-methyltransferase Ste14